jgi:hypothetical protein
LMGRSNRCQESAATPKVTSDVAMKLTNPEF